LRSKLVFFGTEAWGIPVLKQLLEQDYDITIVTRPDAPSGRHRHLAVPPIKAVASDYHLPVLQPDKVGEVRDQIAELGPAIGVVVAYGRIIPSSILDLFSHGLLNVHPSALPKFRGPSPIEATILAGEAPVVTILKVSAEMDAGDVLTAQPIHGEDDPTTMTAPALYQLAGEQGAPLLADGVAATLEGSARFTPQDPAAASFCGRITKDDGIIDWQQSATLIERQIRAYLGWPGSRTQLFGKDVTITLAHVVKTMPGPAVGTAYKTDDGELGVATSDDCLVVDHLIPAGKREMTGRAFLAGHRG
jgi:methionyl-tRNA formyltransferase